MTDRIFLMTLHAGLILLQVGAMVCAIVVDARFSAISPAISLIQAKLPAFPKIKE